MISDKSNSKPFFDLSKISLKNFFIYLFSIVLGVALLIYTFRGVSLNDIKDEFLNINYFYLTLFVIIVFLGTFVRALRWKYILQSFKEDIRISNLFFSTVLGYGVNVVLPRFGEISRALFIGHVENISRSSAFGTIIIERVLDLIFLILSIVLSLILFGEHLSDKYPWIYQSLYFGILLVLVSFVFLFAIVKYKVKVILFTDKIFSKYNLGILGRASEILHKIIEGFESLKKKKNYFLTFILSPVLWFVYSLGSYVGLYMLNMQEIQNVNLAYGLIIMSITTFGIMVPIPGSTGSYHMFCKSVLTMILGFNVQISLAYAVLTHLLSTIPFVMFSILIIIFKGFQKIFVNEK